MQSRLPLWTVFSSGILIGALACSGGGAAAIAQQIQNAIDVLFDNAQSGLQAVNVQDAIDEVDGNVDANEGAIAANGAADQALGAQVVDLQNQIAGLGGGTNLYTQGGETVTGIVTVPANDSADVRPPAGEVWVLDFLAGSGTANTRYGYTDGVTEVTPNNYGSFGVAGKSVVISNGMFLRLRNTSGAPFNVFYSAHKIAAEVRFLIQDVANGNTATFQPPAGETWFVARGFTSEFNQEFISATDGVQTATGFWQGMIQEYTLFPIDNATYLTYTNNSGGTVGVAIMAVKLP